MLGYLRLFSLVSLAFVIIIAIAAGISLRTTTVTELKQVIQRNNITMTQGYINTIWNRYNKTLTSLSIMDAGKWQEDPEIAHFAEETALYFKNAEALRINIYTAGGRLLISTQGMKLVQEKSGNMLPTNYPISQPAAVVELAIGGVTTHFVSDIELQGKNGPMEGSMALTTIPILKQGISEKSGANGLDGIIEVYYDVTNQWDQLFYLELMSSGGVILVFMMLMTILFLVAKKAEGIITKQHEANVELAAAAAAAQAKNQDKSQFLANVSHELRTPLNAIIGFSEIIKAEFMGEVTNEKYQDYINDIHSAGVHLLSLINDILDFSKAEAGKFEFEVDEMNANKAVTNCLRIVATRAEAASVILTDAMPKDQFVMVCDSKRFKQILLNLLSNSIKFTPAGGEVRVSAWQNVMDDTYSFEVKDTGIGILPKDISRAMSAFGQVENSLKRKFEGTGLGLPLTKKFVELMGGKFNITSEIGVGTTVTFTLPRIVIQRDGMIVKQAA